MLVFALGNWLSAVPNKRKLYIPVIPYQPDRQETGHFCEMIPAGLLLLFANFFL
jgi:hypothetical protein